MASLNGLEMNDVWELKQIQAKHHTKPPQPTDESKDLRMYLIIGVVGGSDMVTCCPIQNKDKGIYGHEVELLQVSFPFLSKDCKVISSDIFTLPDYWFTKKIGMINDPVILPKIKNHIKRYLKI